jgi:hypothetical protein
MTPYDHDLILAEQRTLAEDAEMEAADRRLEEAKAEVQRLEAETWREIAVEEAEMTRRADEYCAAVAASLEEARGVLRHAYARLRSAWTEQHRQTALSDVEEARKIVHRLEGYQDPFASEPSSTDPARDEAARPLPPTQHTCTERGLGDCPACEEQAAATWPDPFTGEPPSDDPARDEANHREGARQARADVMNEEE